MLLGAVDPVRQQERGATVGAAAAEGMARMEAGREVETEGAMG